MKKYYVNQIMDESTCDICVIGLFKKCRSSMSNYQSSYYHNAKLLAKYEIHEKNIILKHYNPKKTYTNYEECNVKYKKISIGCEMWTNLIIAKSDEEARMKFKAQIWSDGGKNPWKSI